MQRPDKSNPMDATTARNVTDARDAMDKEAGGEITRVEGSGTVNVKVNGNGGVANIGSQYISYDLALGGNGGVNINWNPQEVAQKRSIFLVE